MFKIETTVDCSNSPSLTKQSFSEQADINSIVAKFERTGMIENKLTTPYYGDVSEIKNYHEALNTVREAQELFMTMDASVRNTFENDPQKLIDFLDDENNYDKAVELGIVSPRPETPKPGTESPKP